MRNSVGHGNLRVSIEYINLNSLGKIMNVLDVIGNLSDLNCEVMVILFGAGDGW